MQWMLRASRRLRELGILGMNRRNAAYILDYNPRANFPVVDDKLRMRDLCRRIVYRNQPAMAMLRLPTKASNGRANLHQGGIGVGVELDRGRTGHAVQHNRVVRSHPDTGASLLGLSVPHWQRVLDMSRRVAEAV